MTTFEYVTGSVLLKQCWILIQAGYDCRQIKFSNNSIKISGKMFGQIIDGDFQCSGNYQPHLSQSLLHEDTTSIQPTTIYIDQQQSSVITQSTDDHLSLPDKLPVLNQPISTSII